VPSSGGTTGSSASATATISYKASDQSYTLSTSGGTITFRPTDLDASLTTDAQLVYMKKSGSTTDTLTLTRPGTTGPVTYQYVGSAFWQHSLVASGSGSGSIDAIAYGVPTPSSAVPVSGRAAYDIALIGARTSSGTPGGIGGTGAVIADFTSGKVFISGTLKDDLTSTLAPFAGLATLASGGNGFSGTFAFEAFEGFRGSVNGRFYGPGAQEIGAAWSANSTSYGTAVGTIMGRKAVLPAENTTISGGVLASSELFTTKAATMLFESSTVVQDSDKPSTIRNQAQSTGVLQINYDAASKAYVLAASDRERGFVNGHVIGLDIHEDETFDPGYDSSLKFVQRSRWFYRSGGPSFGTPYRYRVSELVYGMPTAPNNILRSGLAGYALTFGGSAADSDYNNLVLLRGQGVLRVDLASGGLDLTGNYTFNEDQRIVSIPRISGSGNLTGTGTLSSTSNDLLGTLTLDGIGSYTGNFGGKFYGPMGEEVGGTLSASDSNGSFVGSFAGQKNDAISSAYIDTLQNLTSSTQLRADGLATFSTSNRVVYDPISHSYQFTLSQPYIFGSSVYSFDTSNRDELKSNSERDWYSRSDGLLSTEGYIFKPGAANPILQLTYASFAEFSVVRDDSVHGTEKNYVAFGLQTPDQLVPTSGSATYSGIARGYGRVGNLDAYVDVAGSSSLTADFKNATVRLQLDLATVEARPRNLERLTWTGGISTGGFSAGGHGAFYGPNASEFASVWSISRLDPSNVLDIHGVAIGRKN